MFMYNLYVFIYIDHYVYIYTTICIQMYTHIPLYEYRYIAVLLPTTRGYDRPVRPKGFRGAPFNPESITCRMRGCV